MQDLGIWTVPLLLAVLVCTQQVAAHPLLHEELSPPGSDRGPALRRVARMTPLWRLMNSKPVRAFCQNNYECSTGLCSLGHCATGQRSLSEPATY